MIKLSIAPVAKPRMTRRDKWEQRAPVMRYRNFKDGLRRLAREAEFALGDSIRVEFHVPMPESWSKKKRQAMNGQPHQVTPDTDNFIKGLLDCLLPEADSHVWHIDAKKLWAYEGCVLVENRKD